ncbi:putative autophagy protein Apg6 [Diplogelasinospora grovesii]|uniref:Autophagy protein Apg6 n=1 Tax=Diplogelasinospora grovesii TaxID=303347 RepID=A0AAN6NGH1_9PEZI|nr:putative autophagy protein Apg6 [Diplogelasinospora grovesii]
MYCQKCRTPLKLDSSLGDLNPAAYDLLVATHSQQSPKKLPPSSTPSSASRTLHSQQNSARKSIYDKVSRNAGPPVFKRGSSGAGGRDANHGLRDSSAMSFILLTESQIGGQRPNPQQQEPQNPPSAPQAQQDGASGEDDTTKSYEMERINKLFEILSARSDIDHPICVECTDILVEELQKKLNITLAERDAYVHYLKDMQSSEPTEEELKAQEAALKAAQQKEADARAELLRLEAEKAELDRELLSLESESQELDKEEEDFWRERNAFSSRLTDFQNERDSINSKFDHDSRLLEKLQRSNVYNDTFCISHDGTFATINGLRLGRLSNKPVDWPEINAAWGHSLLLLVTVADRLGYRFEGYEPAPMGSTSKIIRLDYPSNTTTGSPNSSSRQQLGRGGGGPPPRKKDVLELYSSGDMPLGLTFMHRKFDNAMVAFLELVRQLGQHVQQRTEETGGGAILSLPYKIEGDKIGDVSIKLGGIAQDEGWTKACKLTLTCCKFLLAHASNVSSASAGGGGGGNNNGAKGLARGTSV